MQAPGEALVIKLWETITEKGIGSLLRPLIRPWQIRSEGRAANDIRREEILTLAQAEKDADAIRRGEATLVDRNRLKFLGCDGNDVMETQGGNPHPNNNTLTILTDIQIAEEVRKQVNVTRALLYAEETLENDPQEPPKESVNEDWLYRWRDNASQVSTEELQNLWGKLLAGEVKSPGRYSLRTLEFLRNLNKEEAVAIERLSQFFLNSVIFREAQDIFDAEGVSFDFLLSMQELGVISGVGSIGLESIFDSMQSDAFVHPIKSNGMVLLVRGPRSESTN